MKQNNNHNNNKNPPMVDKIQGITEGMVLAHSKK